MTTDKIPIPYFEATGTDGKKIYKPKQWIERFRQYIKRTEKIDINELINEQPVTITDWEINHEEKVKEEFLWALGPNALNEMTKSAYGENPTEMKITRLINLFRENYLPKRNALYSRGDFFWAKQKADETPEQHWKNLIEIEENCDFPNTGIKPADLTYLKVHNLNNGRKTERQINKREKHNHSTTKRISTPRYLRQKIRKKFATETNIGTTNKDRSSPKSYTT